MKYLLAAFAVYVGNLCQLSTMAAMLAVAMLALMAVQDREEDRDSAA